MAKQPARMSVVPNPTKNGTTGAANDPDARLKAAIERMSPEQREAVLAQTEAAASGASSLEELMAEEGGAAESLADLQASTQVWVSVYPEKPNRLKVHYLPVVAGDTRIQATLMRLLADAEKIQHFAKDLIAAGKKFQAEIEAGLASPDDEAEESVEELFDADKFEALMEGYTTRVARYLTTVCNGWTLKEPFTEEVLKGAGLTILQSIFAALRRYDSSKNVSGPTSITTS